MRKIIASALLVASLAGTNVLATASPASADSKGCAAYSTINIGGVTVPSGVYCATVVGSGKYVSLVTGEFYAPNLCNWDVTAEFFTNNWTWKKTYVSSHTYGCSYGSAWKYIYVYKDIQALTGTSTGYMCSTLRVGFQRVTSVCRYIY